MAQKLTVIIVGDDSDLQAALARSEAKVSEFGRTVTKDSSTQVKALDKVAKSEGDLFKIRSRRAASIGPLRLAGIGLGAGVGLFAATQAVSKLGDALKVTGDEALTTQGKLRNVVSASLKGDIIGAVSAFTKTATTLEDLGVTGKNAGDKLSELSHHMDEVTSAATGQAGAQFELALSASRAGEATDKTNAAGLKSLKTFKDVRTISATLSGELRSQVQAWIDLNVAIGATLKAALQFRDLDTGKAIVDPLHLGPPSTAIGPTTFGVPIKTPKPIGPAAKTQAAITVAQAQGQLDEVLRLQLIAQSRSKKALDNAIHKNVKDRTDLNQELATATAAVIGTRKAIKAEGDAAKKTAEDARKARISEHWAKVINALQIKVTRAEMTATLKDDIATLGALAAGLKRQIAAGEDVLSAQSQLAGVESQIASKEQERAQNRKDAAAAARQSRQFRAIGLSPLGAEILPTVKNLSKQLGPLFDNAVSQDVPKKLLNRFAGIKKVLAGGFGAVSEETRRGIADFFATVRGEFEKNKGPLTKTTSLNANRILDGLGLGREAEKELRARLSSFNSAGRGLAGATRPTGQFGSGIAAGGDVVVNLTTTLDGQVVAQNTTRHQIAGKRRNPWQKRGPNRGTWGF